MEDFELDEVVRFEWINIEEIKITDKQGREGYSNVI